MLPKITECPTCGSEKIRRTKRNLTRSYHGRAYVVPNLQLLECPDCGERVYDREAMRKIEAHSPAYARKRAVGER
jgi:YgiT-type zinc finger domain-containing protein